MMNLGSSTPTLPELPMNRDVLTRIHDVEDFPTLSTVAMKVMQMALNPDMSLKDFADIIMFDVALSTRVLKVVNSAYYGLPRQITTVSQAVVVLGARVIRNLSLSLSVLDIFPQEGKESTYTRFWERALCSAVTARAIAERAGLKIGEEAFVAGLLEDIGMFLLTRYFHDDYTRVLREAEQQGIEIMTVEEELLGVTHIQWGTLLAERWALPTSLTIAIQYHHDPKLACEKGISGDDAKVVELAYLGGLAADIFYGWRKGQKISQFKEDLSALLHLDDGVADDLLARLADLTKEAASCFQVQIDTTRSYAEVLQEANAELGRMNIKYDQMYRDLMAAVGELQQKNEELARVTAELEEKNRRLQSLAERDGLTGLFNHRSFQEFLGRQIVQSRRYNRVLSLIMLDIDYFKSFNDTYGHQYGDTILRGLAQILSRSVRQADLVARYGGEEFTIVLAETDLKGAFIVAEKIRRIVERCPFPREDGDPVYVTISLGVAMFSTILQTPHELIEAADKALYDAKQRGRNRVCVYQEE